MVHIIGETKQHSSRVFAQFGINEHQRKLVTQKYESIIAASFNEDARQRRGLTGRVVGDSSGPSTNEINRRFDILEHWTRILLGDLNWSLTKTLDHIADALRHELDGKDYAPPVNDRAMYAAATGESR